MVIKRLDDNNNEVRHITVKSLCTIFCLPMPEGYVEYYQTNLEMLYSEMLVHLNDPEYSFQEIMLGKFWRSIGSYVITFCSYIWVYCRHLSRSWLFKRFTNQEHGTKMISENRRQLYKQALFT